MLSDVRYINNTINEIHLRTFSDVGTRFSEDEISKLTAYSFYSFSKKIVSTDSTSESLRIIYINLSGETVFVSEVLVCTYEKDS
jgi:hypothetical protein